MSLSDLVDLGKNLGTILVFVFYVAIILWTYKDARRRIDDPILIATAVATSFLPLVGVFVYMLLRPPEYLDDVRERELEIRAMERQLGRQERCPHCRSHIESNYLSCPVCATKLREACITCDKPLDPRWVVCPFCETEVSGRTDPKPPAPRRTRSEPRASSARGERTSPAPRGSSKRSDSSSKRGDAAPEGTVNLMRAAPIPQLPLEAVAPPSPLRTEPFGNFSNASVPAPSQSPLQN